ncbi:hypothetical protein LCM4573_26380 [Rhizobium sp. LCM 4573]|nr:hypothetical protein LCM4573_26380 [Rhizobium sp. LCM 4573]
MSIKMKDKVVVVAGGASGAGLAVSRRAVAEGAQVHIIGRSPSNLGRAQGELGASVRTHVADLTVEADVESVIAAIPAIDHVVTTAADLAFKTFLQLDDADIERSFGAKFWGPVYLVRHAAPKLNAGGTITFVSGSAAYKATAGGSAVAAANAALDGLARTLALELAPTRVNVVSPGIFDSPTWDFLDNDLRKQTLESFGASLPIGRVGTVEEVADAVFFFMSNGFATGTVLQIDAGANA